MKKAPYYYSGALFLGRDFIRGVILVRVFE